MSMPFAENLRNELDYQNLIVKELAKRTGININTLNHYLSGRKSMPPVDVAVKIANSLGVSVEYLVTGQERSSRDVSLNSLCVEARLIARIAQELNEKERKIALAQIKILKTQGIDEK